MFIKIFAESGDALEERMYELFKNAMDNQQRCIEYLSETVEKITNSQESTMLLLDETNRRTQEHADKESSNWRLGLIISIGLICATYLAIIAVYFYSPWESSSTSTSTSTSVSEAHLNEQNGEEKVNDIEQLETIESDGD